jgi:hypothetical protein
MNLFDGLVVVASLAELAVGLSPLESSIGGALSAFRSLRCDPAGGGGLLLP